MFAHRWLLISLVATLMFGCDGTRPEDCNEVGYARSAGSRVHQAYESVKEELLQRWKEEDNTATPPYTLFPGSLKNVTRAAYLLERVSKEVLSLIRKTRIGKRCKEEWILGGVEKHVTPLVNLDQQLADELGLVMSFRCMVGSPYPNVDGTCVSEESPDLGAIGSKFLRLLPSKPGLDGFSIRSSVAEGMELPSSRAVSSVIRGQLQQPAVTALFTAWAHFVQQDIFSIPESPLTEGVDCCKSPEAEDCAPILVPESDPLHSSQPCFNFRRSARAQAILGHRESFSVVSTFLDATPLYGPTNEAAFKRKTGFFGYLKGGERVETTDGSCKAPHSFENCFEQEETFKIAPGIRALLVLEHNRIADGLAELNPHFDDPLLYNEARRILIAQYASLLYGQYLPTLMGDAIVKKHLLLPGSEGPAARYIKDVNPGVLTSFAVLAFRNPAMATEWRAAEAGREEVFGSTHYSAVADLPYQDLLALDVQRGRDHGLPGYLSWRRFCEPGLVLNSWQDLEQVLPAAAVAALKELYGDQLDDIDAMAALLEPPVEGGVAGKTLTCIMADQFARLRTGNRLFWEHEQAMLTAEQKEEVKGVTFAALLCSNLPVTAVPTNPLLPVADGNPLIQCADVKPINLSLWTDTSLIESMKAIKENGEDRQTIHEADAAPAEADKMKAEYEGSDGQTKTPEKSSGVKAVDATGSSSSRSGSAATAEPRREGDPTVRMAGHSQVDGTKPLTTASVIKEEL